MLIICPEHNSTGRPYDVIHVGHPEVCSNPASYDMQIAWVDLDVLVAI